MVCTPKKLHVHFSAVYSVQQHCCFSSHLQQSEKRGKSASHLTNALAQASAFFSPRHGSTNAAQYKRKNHCTDTKQISTTIPQSMYQDLGLSFQTFFT